MNVFIKTTILLTLSNVFMTFAWYSHLRNMSDKKWYVAAIVSWGIALFEYLIQVPANRIGYSTLSLAQLKILQEVITLSVFVPFVLLYMQQPLKNEFSLGGSMPSGSRLFHLQNMTDSGFWFIVPGFWLKEKTINDKPETRNQNFIVIGQKGALCKGLTCP